MSATKPTRKNPPPQSNPLQLITRTDVMELLSISRSTLHRLVQRGVLNPVSITSDCPRYRVVEVEQLILSGGGGATEKVAS